MKINELLEIINDETDISKVLNIKKYIPASEKKQIIDSIIDECMRAENGVIKLDSMQKYMSFIKYMIVNYTNLEYEEDDYDVLCSTYYCGNSLLNAIIAEFNAEMQECDRFLDFAIENILRENSLEYMIGKFLCDAGYMMEKISDKIADLDTNKIEYLLKKINRS